MPKVSILSSTLKRSNRSLGLSTAVPAACPSGCPLPRPLHSLSAYSPGWSPLHEALRWTVREAGFPALASRPTAGGRRPSFLPYSAAGGVDDGLSGPVSRNACGCFPWLQPGVLSDASWHWLSAPPGCSCMGRMAVSPVLAAMLPAACGPGGPSCRRCRAAALGFG